MFNFRAMFLVLTQARFMTARVLVEITTRSLLLIFLTFFLIFDKLIISGGISLGFARILLVFIFKIVLQLPMLLLQLTSIHLSLPANE